MPTDILLDYLLYPIRYGDHGVCSFLLYICYSMENLLTYVIWVWIIRSVLYKIKCQNPNPNSLCKIANVTVDADLDANHYDEYQRRCSLRRRG
jgi:hypothetical protein